MKSLIFFILILSSSLSFSGQLTGREVERCTWRTSKGSFNINEWTQAYGVQMVSETVILAQESKTDEGLVFSVHQINGYQGELFSDIGLTVHSYFLVKKDAEGLVEKAILLVPCSKNN